MPNFFEDAENQEENFKDQPEETEGKYDSDGNWIAGEAPHVQIGVTKPASAPKPQSVAPPVQVESEEDDTEEETEEVNNSDILSNARLRLEQGRLFEMVMKHDLFDGVDADPRAIKAVTKLIRDYAQERMEIMLGMRQEPSSEPINAFPMELFPFNSLEVDTLKALAAAATKGASRDAEPLDLTSEPATPSRTTLKPIGGVRKPTQAPVPKLKAKPLQSKAKAPVKRLAQAVEQILREEGVSAEEYSATMDGSDLTREQMAKMTEDEIVARNKRIRNQRAKAQVTTPMPTVEQQITHYTQRSEVAGAQTKGWRELMDMVKAMPPTLVNNAGQE